MVSYSVPQPWNGASAAADAPGKGCVFVVTSFHTVKRNKSSCK